MLDGNKETGLGLGFNIGISTMAEAEAAGGQSPGHLVHGGSLCMFRRKSDGKRSSASLPTSTTSNI